MKVTFDVNREDFWNLNKFIALHIRRFRVVTILYMLAGPIGVALGGWFSDIDLLIMILLTVIVGPLISLLLYKLTKNRIMQLPNLNSGTLGEHTIEINEAGLIEKTNVNDGFCSWAGVKDVLSNKYYIFIFIDTLMAHIIPKRAFSSEEEAENFYQSALTYWKQKQLS